MNSVFAPQNFCVRFMLWYYVIAVIVSRQYLSGIEARKQLCMEILFGHG